MWIKKLKLLFYRKKKSKLYRNVCGVVFFAMTVFIGFSLFYYHPGSKCSSGTKEYIGNIGCSLASSLRENLGISAFLLLPLLLVLLCMLVAELRTRVIVAKLAGYLFVLFCCTIFLSVFSSFFSKTPDYLGGRLGLWAKTIVLEPKVGKKVGPPIVAVSLLLTSVILVFRISILPVVRLLAGSVLALLTWAGPHTSRIGKDTLVKPGLRTIVNLRDLLVRIASVCRLWIVSWVETLRDRFKLYLNGRKKENLKKEHLQDAKGQPQDITESVIAQPLIPEKKIEEIRGEAKKTPEKMPLRVPVQQKLPLLETSGDYALPSINLLDSPNGNASEIDRATVEARKVALQKKLEDLGISGKVVDPPQPGPIITMYRFDPDPGVKVRRIVALADDLAMAMKAFGVRVLAPIPGEPVVGIEVPNPRREKVTIFLKEIIESNSFQEAPSRLTLALGKQITGEPFVDDLARMPHLLVAGATGTGKSVSLNAMILSILFKATPEDVRFIMIDPKMLELAVYEGIPHLWVPVVTDPEKAAQALAWAMEEMDRRYRLMREKGARNLDHYNRLLEREVRKGKSALELEETDEMKLDSAAIGGHVNGQAPLVHTRLPRIVIIIDELADLMMTSRRGIEEHITRLAQKARAAGIHLIVATQRPSVDVITGLIKANFSARISFQVTSRVDSRTILDSIGAEKLLGNGDMLFLPPGTARVIRVHGAYVSDREVQEVVKYVKSKGEADYHNEIFKSKKAGAVDDSEDLDDEIYDQAVAFVTDSQQASISMVQRRFRIGYNRAARLIDRMEKEGVVSPAEGSKPREVYAKKAEAG